MSNLTKQLSESHDVSAKVAQLLQTRTKLALDHYSERVKEACERSARRVSRIRRCRGNSPLARAQYAVDFAQRSILFWDTLRQRGNNFLEHERQGLPPVLHFDYEIDHGRALAQASGQLRAAAHRSAKGRHGRCQAPPLRHHRPARRSRSRHRRLQGRFAGRRGAARRPPRVLRHLLPESRAGTDAARRVRRRARVRAPRARAASRSARSRQSSATARPAGRR